MPAIKSDCPTRAEINRHFVISYEITGEKGSKLIGAGKYESLVGEKLKIKHFNEVLSGKRYQLLSKSETGLQSIFDQNKEVWKLKNLTCFPVSGVFL